MNTKEVAILTSAGCTDGVVAHCLAVTRTALSIADGMSVPVNRELVRQGAMLHDLGRSVTHGIGHAVAGVEVAKGLGFSPPLISIIERHIGAGITEQEAERLGLPKKNYLPVTLEEKLVSYADNLVNGVREIPFPEALDRFRNLLGPDHEGVELFIRQHQEIQRWMRGAKTEEAHIQNGRTHATKCEVKG